MENLTNGMFTSYSTSEGSSNDLLFQAMRNIKQKVHQEVGHKFITNREKKVKLHEFRY